MRDNVKFTDIFISYEKNLLPIKIIKESLIN